MDASDTYARTQSTASNLNTPADASRTLVMQNLPARGAELHMGEPERLEKPTDVSNTWTHAQNVVSDSLRPENNQNTSKHPKTARRNQTYLIEAQNRTQRSHRGSETTHMHRTHAHTRRAVE